jgi:hypothetical protein
MVKELEQEKMETGTMEIIFLYYGNLYKNLELKYHFFNHYKITELFL